MRLHDRLAARGMRLVVVVPEKLVIFTAAVDEPPLPMRRHRVKRREGMGACQGRLALSKGWKSVSISFLYTSMSDTSHFPRARNSTSISQMSRESKAQRGCLSLVLPQQRKKAFPKGSAARRCGRRCYSINQDKSSSRR